MFFIALLTLLFSGSEEKIVSLGRPASQAAQPQSPYVSYVPQTALVVFTPELEQTFTRETLSNIQAKIPAEFGAPTRVMDCITCLYEAQWIAPSGNSYVKLNEGDFRLSHKRYVCIKINGKVIGRDGKVIAVTSTTPIPENALESRIPLEEWLNWRFFDKSGDVTPPPPAVEADDDEDWGLTLPTNIPQQPDVSAAEATQGSPPEQRGPKKPEPPKESPLLTPEFERLFPRKTLERIDRKVPRDHGEWRLNQDQKGMRCLTKHGQKDIRIDKGNPNAELSCHRIDHVRVNKGGRVIDRDGKEIKSTFSGHDTASEPHAHIPLEEWLNWRFWFQP